ncbi:hypothetical protein [Pedobacter endophyticus]|uniref:Uncharacterized protein n=1 Tax=Pedobacter endophyticus TaxID=2789740 RepID=A0A7S9L1G4_9SPHI|nr:hypothetical protein [Pedobacter endophyticus]QPH40739.1 hypothetical protein IZT61_05575 [Pedobacter endophyticus]
MNAKKILFYCWSILLLLVSLTIAHLLNLSLDWQHFVKSATDFLSVMSFMLIALLALTFAVYFFRKALNWGKKKEHIRYL